MKNNLHIKSFLFVCFALQAKAQVILPENQKLQDIRQEIFKMIEDSIIPSMGVSVIKDGAVIWQEAIGYADIENKEKATIHSIYPLGSVAKSITATGIMEMINDNTLSLYGNVQDYLKPIKLKNSRGGTPIIKLWQLISQNAGVNHGYGVFLENELPKTEKQITDFIEKSTIVAFKPGTNYHYSNHSFDLSELIIEKVSGKSFEIYMQENLYQPLGMKETFAYPYKHPNENFVTTYSSKMNPIKNNNTITYPAGGSSWWSSISDLTKYVQFHMGINPNENVINSENLKMMHEFRQGPADLFGIGWFNDVKEQTLYSNGNVGGGNAAIFIDKKNNLGIITLLNRTSWDGVADQINGKIKDVLAPNPHVHNYESWQRIYGTPYTKKLDLLGLWKGIIKEPVTEKEVPISLHFNDLGEIIMSLGGEKITLENSIYNLKGNFVSEFNGVLPSIYDKETKCVLNLNQDGNSFEGYIQYDNDSDERFYTLPLFIQLKKEK